MNDEQNNNNKWNRFATEFIWFQTCHILNKITKQQNTLSKFFSTAFKANFFKPYYKLVSPIVSIIIMVVRGMPMSVMSVVPMGMVGIIIPVRTVYFISVVNWTDYSWLGVNSTWAWSVLSLWCLWSLRLWPADDCSLLIGSSKSGWMEDNVSWVLDLGAWFVGVNGCSEAVLVGYVFDDTSSSILDCEGVGADDSTRSVPSLLSGAWAILSLGYVIESVWGIAVWIWCSWNRGGVDRSPLLCSWYVRL